MDHAVYDIPNDLLYTKEHEWAMLASGTVRVGITDFAAKTLNDIVYVTLPKEGSRVTQFKEMGAVESIKAVSELYSPASGTVVNVNHELDSHPELVNKSPYKEGWLLELVPDNFALESKNLLDSKAYSIHIASQQKQDTT